MEEPPVSVSQEVKAANKFLWAVKTYIDLISRDDQLVYGSGLKRLYAMASGVGTLNENDIEAIAAKSDHLKLVSQNLHGFMMGAILKNLHLYGKELQRIIVERIVGISNGDIVNPEATLKYNPESARRFYYLPPVPFIARVKKALIDDLGLVGYRFSPPQVTHIQDVANEADFILTRMQNTEGYITPTESAWGAIVTVVEELVSLLDTEARYASPDRDYKVRARGALKILWFITKLLTGDLTIKPVRREVNLIDLDHRLNLTDGTLAAIPFPLKETVNLFSDIDGNGISMKGRIYLSAVSTAAFYRNDRRCDD